MRILSTKNETQTLKKRTWKCVVVVKVFFYSLNCNFARLLVAMMTYIRVCDKSVAHYKSKPVTSHHREFTSPW